MAGRRPTTALRIAVCAFQLAGIEVEQRAQSTRRFAVQEFEIPATGKAFAGRPGLTCRYGSLKKDFR